MGYSCLVLSYYIIFVLFCQGVFEKKLRNFEKVFVDGVLGVWGSLCRFVMMMAGYEAVGA